MVKYSCLYIFIVLLTVQYTLKAQSNKVLEVFKLTDAVNSEAEEIMPLLSAGGDSLFFARIFHDDNVGGFYSGSDIWLSTYNKELGEWSAATNKIKKWNDKLNNFVVGMNQNEKLFYTNHPKKPEKGLKFIKVAYGISFEPETISIPGIPSSGYQGMYVSPDGEAILLTMKAKDSFGEEDLYVVLKNAQGQWEKPLNLGVTINTAASEISPFLSPDKKHLFFASKGHGGFGDMDIFVSERLYNSWTVWSRPINLGEKINSSAFDAYYSQYTDTIAFFSSNREGELSDIYQVRLKTQDRKNNSANTIFISTEQEKSQRNYLSQQELQEEMNFPVNFSLELESSQDLTNDKILQEKIWYMASKMEGNNLKVAFSIRPSNQQQSEIIVSNSNEIIKSLIEILEDLSINRSAIYYDGIELNALPNENEKTLFIVPRFFKD